MKSKKVTMIAAAFVVAVVAFAAVGFATVYKAETTNSNNTAKSTYITVDQSGTGAYTAAGFINGVYFDTTNTALSEYTYSLVTDHKVSSGAYVKDTSTGDLALLSSVLTLDVKGTNSVENKLNLDVEVTNFTPITGMDYIMVVATSAATDSSATPMSGVDAQTVNSTTTTSTASHYDATNKVAVWKFTDIGATNGAVTFTVLLFVKCANALTNEPDSHVGFNVGTTTQTPVDSVFTFTVTADTSNDSNGN